MTAFISKMIALFMSIIAFFTVAIQFVNKQEAAPTEPAETETAEPQPTEPQPGSEAWIQAEAQKLYDDMTLRERVGQLFCVAPEALQVKDGVSYSSTVWNDAMDEVMADYPAGGIIFFGANV